MNDGVLLMNSFACVSAALLAVFTLLVPVSFSTTNNLLSGGPYYYESWEGYGVPFKPRGSLRFDEAKKLVSYYEAYYDATGKIVSFTKYLNGQIEWADKYFYSSTGLLEKREMRKAGGEFSVQYFSENGQLIMK